VALASGASAIFTLITGGGHGDSDLADATLRSDKEHRVTGEMDAGEGRIPLRSGDGQIALED